MKISQIEKRLADQKLRSEDKNKCKGAKLWESVRLFKNKNYNKVHQVYQVSQNGLTRPSNGHLIIQRHMDYGLTEKTLSMLHETAQKTLHKEDDGYRKKQDTKWSKSN